MTLDKVVDASVVAALAFGEPRAAEARELLSGAILHAPNLLPYELCGVAQKKSRRRPDQIVAIAAGLQLALGIDVTLMEVPYLELLPLALAHALSTYDAAYLWVARDLHCELLTFDQRLARVANTT